MMIGIGSNEYCDINMYYIYIVYVPIFTNMYQYVAAYVMTKAIDDNTECICEDVGALMIGLISHCYRHHHHQHRHRHRHHHLHQRKVLLDSGHSDDWSILV